jgi:aldehyde dehydrogenase (NAD+)
MEKEMPTAVRECSIKHLDRLFIAGEWVRPDLDRDISVITPSTEELYVSVAEAQAGDVNRAVAAARDAFDRGPWPRMSHAERAAYIAAAAEVLARRSGEASQLWTSEMGVLHKQALGMIGPLPQAMRYYSSLADSYPFIEAAPCQDPARKAFIVREAVGVAALIVPWNSPLHLIIYKMTPALLAGCTVIVKNSPEAPLDGYLMAEVMEEIGLPKGVFNMITAEREVSELLVRHPGVDKVSFTGSTAAGKKIASICGERIARCTLELGGKSAAIVLEDYDVSKVAQVIAGSTCFITNQVCSALSRIVIPRSRHSAMVDALSSAFGAIKIGDPFSESTELGPLAMSRQRDRVEQYIADGIKSGAQLATGGKRPTHLNRGYYIEPTVFGGVDPGSLIAQEEIFGPVVTIIPAKDETDALEIANGTIYGLNSAVFTNDLDRAYRFGRQLRAGTFGHNSFQTDFSSSFGGFKQSGIGREGGKEGLLPFLETKTMILEGTPDFTADLTQPL